MHCDYYSKPLKNGKSDTKNSFANPLYGQQNAGSVIDSEALADQDGVRLPIDESVSKAWFWALRVDFIALVFCELSGSECNTYHQLFIYYLFFVNLSCQLMDHDGKHSVSSVLE